MWIIQKNIWKDQKYQNFCNLLGHYNIDYKMVNVIPFTDNIEPHINYKDVTMAFGSIRMMDILRDNNVKTFFNDNFNYLVWSDIFKNFCLNDPKDTTIFNLNEKFITQKDCFLRPILDDKSFSGIVLKKGDGIKQIQFCTSKPINSFDVAMSPLKKIYSEYRCFVIDDEIVDISLYKEGKRVVYKQCKDIEVWNFANKMINIWKPSKMFVIDIAKTNSDDEFSIVEFGSIHNCGFYDIDLNKLIQKIIEYYENI